MSEKHVIWVQVLVSAPFTIVQGKLNTMFRVNVEQRMSCYVYILKCKDASYYTGITSNLKQRIFEHNSRIKSCLQKSKVPVELVYSAQFKTRIEAARREKEIKGWSRLKKERLIQESLLRTVR